MDVDSGKFKILFPSNFSDIFRVLDTPRVVIPKKPATKKAVRLLPYDAVPKLDISSRLFQKAEEKIAKQAAPTLVASNSKSPTPKTSLERLAGLQQGMSYFILLLDSSNQLCSDIDLSIIGDLDLTIIKRARDVVTNATMVELLNEEPDGPDAHRNAVRQQIVALCTRLRISLVIIDSLMGLANSLSQQSGK
jgi:hypothetical protein